MEPRADKPDKPAQGDILLAFEFQPGTKKEVKVAAKAEAKARTEAIAAKAIATPTPHTASGAALGKFFVFLFVKI